MSIGRPHLSWYAPEGDELLILRALMSLDDNLLAVGAHLTHIRSAMRELEGPGRKAVLIGEPIRPVLQHLVAKGLISPKRGTWKDPRPASEMRLFTLTAEQRQNARLLIDAEVQVAPPDGRLRVSLLAD